MSSKFPTKDVNQLLVACKRRCCICHRFCGVKIEIDHIIPSSENGPDTIDNAIAVCFECHAEIHSYNDKHPRGRKFRPDELRAHKENWINICEKRPEIILTASRETDVGPVQSLIDELEFNIKVAEINNIDSIGCSFRENEFNRAISEGAISLLNENLKEAVIRAYWSIGRANHSLQLSRSQPAGSTDYNNALGRVKTTLEEANKLCIDARKRLLEFLSHSD